MTTREIKLSLKRKIANVIIGDIVKNCQEINKGLASALDAYHAIRGTLTNCKIGMRVEYDGPNIDHITLYDEIDGDYLLSAAVEPETSNNWLTIHQLLKNYDGESYSVEILDKNADILYYTDDLSNIYSDIDIELLLGHVLDYKEVGRTLTIILEA